MSKVIPDVPIPAWCGGVPSFPEGLPLARPPVGNSSAVASQVESILASGVLTNGPHVREFEARAADYLGVRHCIAVSSCTSGLMLVIRALGLSGEIIVPSFTFAATAHAVAWNGLRPRFADISPGTLTLSPDAVSQVIGVRTSAILATHVFGTPCDVDGLAEIARRTGIALLLDAAHAFGSIRRGIRVGGFGDAEVFSLSPTKVLTAGEGGLITTNNDLLAERCRMGRDYGNPGDYNCRFVGLNARMSEVHAAIGLDSLEDLESRIKARNDVADAYRAALASIPGISFPDVPASDRSTYKDFTALIDASEFGMNAQRLSEALDSEGIETRRYYSPPVHTMRAYRSLSGANGSLAVTQRVSDQALTLPLWGGMTRDHIIGVADTIERIHYYQARSGGTEGGAQ